MDLNGGAGLTETVTNALEEIRQAGMGRAVERLS
jgi:hypothetical protein